MIEFVVLNTVTALVLFLLSLVFRKYRPKNINGLYGYRTGRSMKSQQAWDFAQDYSSALMVKLCTGYFIWQLVLTLVGVLFLADYTDAVAIAGNLIIVPLLLVMIVKTEKELKRKFPF
jgi:uncharacterized membrane protein